MAAAEVEANTYLRNVGLLDINDVRGMPLNEISSFYSRASILASEYESQAGFLTLFWKACSERLSAILREQIQARGEVAKDEVLEEIKSKLDDARDAYQATDSAFDRKEAPVLRPPEPKGSSANVGSSAFRAVQKETDAVIAALQATTAAAASVSPAVPRARGASESHRKSPEKATKKRAATVKAAVAQSTKKQSSPATSSLSNTVGFKSMVRYFD
jgi:hypothetical protein